ncbi:cyclopropane-fatty-acyl-phospholipid synthase family protein [Kitasatospora sp. NBC_01287]|uniref:SAM-dependent methyltransferase n=1 Tax=Kitasatospora sp. NBC_01287 TaxID=2903573 RepID=UPI00224DD327|nr:cyclopropane-fatty-acyl-phospholipid synthase family protein [Kitasatospora sp. NBC_01287]MCX4751633.1 cyclopropane-fatty-acyl-phospholipid synthase family protein [Kitasatospora sp. NBC_01287]
MTAAALLAPLLTELLDGPPPFRLRAWDGSTAGPADAPTVVLRNRAALRRLLWQPGELGLADAYITGDLEVEGDLTAALGQVRRALAGRGPIRPAARHWPRLLTAAARLGALGPRPAPPHGRAKVRGALHSRTRDQAVISHHYDLSNEFYALLLGPAMAYSCAYWTGERENGEHGSGERENGERGSGEHEVRGHETLEQAQRAKFDLICRKLDLRPGARLLDVGCGWGALAVHAARHYGAQVTAVTLSGRQHAFAEAAVQNAGLAGQVRVRLRDYREIADGPYDAISCVEMGEHVGDARYPAFARRLRGLLVPGGRLLVQQMSRGANAPGGGAFIETYIAPDMHMRPVGSTADLLEAAGLEVRQVEAMREHYARTIDAWHERLLAHPAEFAELVGEATVRLWRLYLAGSSLAFSEGRMGVDQILAVRPGTDGAAGMPPTPDWYRP